MSPVPVKVIWPLSACTFPPRFTPTLELPLGTAATAAVPVLALSADYFAPTPQEALGAGCASFIGKPVTPESLLNEIRRAFRHAVPGRTA